MPDEHKTDIMMRFTTLDGQDVLAECALDKASDDKLMLDFKPQTYNTFSNFFEIAKFGFNFEVKDEDKSKSTLSSTQSTTKPQSKKISGSVQGEFASWRSATDKQLPSMIYPILFQPFRFERVIDSASPIFFQNCCTSTSFKSAALVKRVSRGGDKTAKAFLRIDFDRPLITSLGWDDGNMTTEKGEFVCRDFKIQYFQQSASGEVSPTSNAHWNSVANAIKSGNGSSG